MHLALVTIVGLLLLLVQCATAYRIPREDMMQQKRDPTPGWENLGWAWGKRSSPVGYEIPIRFVRALHPMKKNPDWHDLGWTWGRK